MSAALSICCMVLLGFADDVLNLRWKYKLIFPALAALPLLMVYWSVGGTTFVVFPKWVCSSWMGGQALSLLPCQSLCGSSQSCSVNLGIFYYLFMVFVSIFCTNSINILAGVNGLEVGQSLVIALSVVINNGLQIALSYPSNHEHIAHHLISLLLMVPFLCVSVPLFMKNSYPARVFVGDTYCYFAGMAFAVAGILGHFSKTLCLFFIPQIVNFLYSMPQLFGLVPCPRHRLPRINPDTGLLDVSLTIIRLDIDDRPGARFVVLKKKLTLFVIKTLRFLKLLHVESRVAAVQSHQISEIEKTPHQTASSELKTPRRSVRFRSSARNEKDGDTHREDEDEDEVVYYVNNMTLLNFFLLRFGSCTEKQLTNRLLVFQTLCSLCAFVIRYYVAEVVYVD